MENLKHLTKSDLNSTSGGFVPVVILGTVYSAKAVAGYFIGVAGASSAITVAVISDNKN